MEKYMETNEEPASQAPSEPVKGPDAEPLPVPDPEPAGEADPTPDPEPAAETASAPDAAPPEKANAARKDKPRRPVFLILLLVVLLLVVACAAAAGSYVYLRLDNLEEARQVADDLKAGGNYARALDLYARLLEDDALSFTPFTNAFVSAGADGVVSCADALLETSEGAHYLAENDVLQKAQSHATHPAVPASFSRDMERRALLCQAILAQEAGDLEKALELLNQADLRRELSYPIESVLDREATLAAALQAREEGRYEDAIRILTRSILEPEMVAELQQQIVEEQDARIMAQAQAAMDDLDPATAIQTLRGLSKAEDQIAWEQAFTETWARKLSELHTAYENRLCAGAWYSLVLGDKPLLTGDKRYDGLAAALTTEGRTVAGTFSLIQLKDGQVTLLGDTLGSEAAAREITDAKDAALGLNHGLVLHEDGTVTNLGARQYGRGAVADWTDIVQVAAGGFHSLGLKADGTVAAAGLDLDGQCQVTGWTDVVAVAAGLRHSVALTKDGHVVATGDNSFGQCDVSLWENVIEVRCGGNFTLGLTADWRLLATGDNSCGQCDVSGWQEVLSFDAGLWHTVALLSDGHVVTTGSDTHGQRAVDGTVLFASKRALGPVSPAEAKAETEFVYFGHPSDGPWLYYSAEGCLIIAFDAEAGRIKPTRADLICTDGHPPVGILSGGGDKPGLAVHATILARQNQAVFALTGDYFTFGYNADGLQIRRGVVFKEDQDELGFGFFPDGSMRIIDPKTTTAEELLSQGVRDSWVFGPVLIVDGQARDISYHPLSYNDVTMRTVVGSLCPYHHIAVAYSSSTLAQVIDNLLGYGCNIAYNLDGGRSCMMVFMGNKIVNRSMYINNGWRGLQDMVGFLTSDLVPKS